MLSKQMPRDDYRRCRECGRHASEAGPLSHTRLCADCGVEILGENVMQIHLREGPYHERRRYGIALSEFGPRVALALKQAGFFDGAPVDATATHT